MDTKKQMRSLARDASDALCEAIEKLEELRDMAPDEFKDLDPYIIAHLRGWWAGDNPHDATAIPRLIERIKEMPTSTCEEAES